MLCSATRAPSVGQVGGKHRAERGAAPPVLPLRLDVAGLKAQVLGRIEDLGSELVPAMEVRGYDAGTVQAMMRG
jgi:hypothetical protein